MKIQWMKKLSRFGPDAKIFVFKKKKKNRGITINV